MEGLRKRKLSAYVSILYFCALIFLRPSLAFIRYTKKIYALAQSLRTIFFYHSGYLRRTSLPVYSSTNHWAFSLFIFWLFLALFSTKTKKSKKRTKLFFFLPMEKRASEWTTKRLATIFFTSDFIYGRFSFTFRNIFQMNLYFIRIRAITLIFLGKTKFKDSLMIKSNLHQTLKANFSISYPEKFYHWTFSLARTSMHDYSTQIQCSEMRRKMKQRSQKVLFFLFQRKGRICGKNLEEKAYVGVSRMRRRTAAAKTPKAHEPTEYNTIYFSFNLTN